MAGELWKWVLQLPRGFAAFGTWLVTPLDYINVAPLALFGVGAIALIVGFKVVRLVVG